MSPVAGVHYIDTSLIVSVVSCIVMLASRSDVTSVIRWDGKEDDRWAAKEDEHRWDPQADQLQPNPSLDNGALPSPCCTFSTLSTATGSYLIQLWCNKYKMGVIIWLPEIRWTPKFQAHQIDKAWKALSPPDRAWHVCARADNMVRAMLADTPERFSDEDEDLPHAASPAAENGGRLVAGSQGSPRIDAR